MSYKYSPSLLFALALFLTGAIWYFYPQTPQKEVESLTIEKIVVTPLEGKVWREDEMRAVVAFCPEVSKHRPTEWKPWGRVRVYFQRTSPAQHISSRWYGSLSVTTDAKGKLVPSACVSSGPNEVDEQGKMIELPEKAPVTSIQHYVIDFEISLPKNQPATSDITFINRIANDSAVLPVSVTIPRNMNR